MATTTQRDLTDVLAARSEREGHSSPDRAEAIVAIRSALKRRTGRTWSVTGGRGTAYGWLTVHAPPKRRTQPFGYMTDDDRAVLAHALGLESVHDQGVSIPSGDRYREEYVARAEGRAVLKHGVPYWD